MKKLNSLITKLFPTSCICCGAVVTDGELFCIECRRYVLDLVSKCNRCGSFTPYPEKERCADCQNLKIKLDGIYAPWIYAGAVSHTIRHMKYGRRMMKASLLAHAAVEHVPSEMKNVDAVVAPPMTFRERFSRGFNQAEIIALAVAKAIEKPFLHRVLVKGRKTNRQAELPRNERFKNLSGAFYLRSEIKVEKVLIVDDVATTLSTAHELSAVLKKGGVEKVHLFTLARSSTWIG